MKVLIDAQLPRRLFAQFRQTGLEAIHTLDLPGLIFLCSSSLNVAVTHNPFNRKSIRKCLIKLRFWLRAQVVSLVTI
jgi:hypothetical protein